VRLLRGVSWRAKRVRSAGPRRFR